MKDTRTTNKDKMVFHAGEIHTNDYVYRCIGNPAFAYIWASEYTRLENLVELRYQVRAWYAEKTLDGPDRIYEKLEHIADSDWHKTPQQCREEIANNAGIEFGEVVNKNAIGSLPAEIRNLSYVDNEHTQ
ncbi:hypothetical protein MHI12_16705 [Paenibacillus sp. FSL H8-0280]|uniref:hypothetical protein n=1 Tax=Paenibacillus sp. FSL H8-0280 TaxID=2921382 RepID=UPI0032499125